MEYLGTLIPVHQFMTDRGVSSPPPRSLIFVFNLFWSMKKGKKAPDQSLGSHHARVDRAVAAAASTTLAGVHPVVNHGPYEYSVPGAAKDYIMQTDPATVTAH